MLFYESVFVVDEDYKLKDPYDIEPSGARLSRSLLRKASKDNEEAYKNYKKNPTFRNEDKWHDASEKMKKAGSRVDSYYGARDHANEGTKKYRKSPYYREKLNKLLDRD